MGELRDLLLSGLPTGAADRDRGRVVVAVWAWWKRVWWERVWWTSSRIFIIDRCRGKTAWGRCGTVD